MIYCNQKTICLLPHHLASLMVQMVKNPLAVLEIRVQSLSREDPLEKGMTTHSSILLGKFRGQRSGLQSMRSHRIGHN